MSLAASSADNRLVDSIQQRRLDIRGVVLDLDGTALRSDHTLSPRMIALGQQLRRQQIWLTLASARPPRSVCSFAAALASPGPVVALNGALVVAATGEVVWRKSLPGSVAATIRERYDHDPYVSINLYSGFDWLVARYDDSIAGEAGIVGFEPGVLTDEEWPCTDKLLLMVAPGEEPRYVSELQAMSAEILVTVSKPGYLEVTHRHATKGTALEVAAASVSLHPSALIGAGDAENDVPVLASCGLSIAMRHSPEATKRAASHVVGSNDDDSLPRFIARLLSPSGAPHV